MRVDLWDVQNLRTEGTLEGPDGRTYSRRTTRMSRRKADEMVHSGVPVVLDLYGHSRLEWCDGDDATAEWSQERAYVITSEPTAKQLAKHEMWNAGLWVAADGHQVLYLTGRC